MLFFVTKIYDKQGLCNGIYFKKKKFEEEEYEQVLCDRSCFKKIKIRRRNTNKSSAAESVSKKNKEKKYGCKTNKSLATESLFKKKKKIGMSVKRAKADGDEERDEMTDRFKMRKCKHSN